MGQLTCDPLPPETYAEDEIAGFVGGAVFQFTAIWMDNCISDQQLFLFNFHKSVSKLLERTNDLYSAGVLGLGYLQ